MRTAASAPAQPVVPKPPAYFVRYDDLVVRAKALADTYPDLVTVRDIGDSSATRAGGVHRDIIAIELTNKKIHGPKPVVEHIAGVHGNELANPALLLDWAEQLLAGYGHDATATATLDTRDISLIPMVNPDGNVQAEQGLKRGKLEQYYRGRLNGETPHRVDLNRNFDYHWGHGGSSPDPFEGGYRGAYPASEAEVQAVQAYTELRRPSLFIDWHSYSGLVLRPQGETNAPTKDEPGLKAVGDRFAARNGYESLRSFELYPTSGTSDAWAYGKLGIPAFTIETGTPVDGDPRDGHLQVISPEGFDRVRRENMPVLWDAALIGDRPVERTAGPTAQGWANPTKHRFDAAAWSPDAKIARAELVFDPRVPEGRGITLHASDGAFDAPYEQVSGRLPANAAARAHDDLVYVRAQNEQGAWGPASPVFLHDDPKDRHFTVPVSTS